MKTAEMKQILADKFKAENCYFTKKDIIIKKVDNEKYYIYIKDYEHITFKLITDYDDYFGYSVFITNKDMQYNNEDILVNDNYKYDFENALIELGYYIATRF